MDILVSEVGPRDGLQSIQRAMPTEAKRQWITALAHAGVREIEVGSFVDPRRLPQMADADAAVRHAITIPGLTVVALVPNLRGAENAIAAGAHKLTVPVCASEAMSRRNVNMSCDQSVAEVIRICQLRDSIPAQRRPQIEVGIACAFGCAIQGEVEESHVFALANTLADAGVDSVGLSDSVGYANPVQIRRMFARLAREIGAGAGGAHLHNTRGQGLANVVAALDVGVTTFDASLGGIGGCPYAPGASGNIVTEDLVFLLESMGHRTGIDLMDLIASRLVLNQALPGEPLYGHLPDAGLPKTWHIEAA